MRILSRRHAGHVDREVLVVVALPGDAGVEEDFAQSERQGETEARRFAGPRHEVVDREPGIVTGGSEIGGTPVEAVTALVPTWVFERTADEPGISHFPIRTAASPAD